MGAGAVGMAMRPILLVCLALLAGCAGLPVDSAPGDSDSPDGPSETPVGSPVPSPAPPDADATVTVERVVDGDTLKISYDNGTEDTVRLIGVDTPEVHAENSPEEFEGVPETTAGEDCLRRWGERASEVTKELDGETVGLAFDENLDRRGYYGRLLAYVVVDGGTHNFRLVSEGYGRVYDSSFTERETYDAAEERARTDGVGLWTCADGAETQSATPTHTATPEGGLSIVEIHEDAEGRDGENLNDEYVVLANRGDPIDLSGWTVSDEADHTYAFGDRTLGSGERVTLHTGSGTDDETDVYWGAGSPVWNNDGDTVTVRAANGTVVVRRSY